LLLYIILLSTATTSKILVLQFHAMYDSWLFADHGAEGDYTQWFLKGRITQAPVKPYPIHATSKHILLMKSKISQLNDSIFFWIIFFLQKTFLKLEIRRKIFQISASVYKSRKVDFHTALDLLFPPPLSISWLTWREDKYICSALVQSKLFQFDQTKIILHHHI